MYFSGFNAISFRRFSVFITLNILAAALPSPYGHSPNGTGCLLITLKMPLNCSGVGDFIAKVPYAWDVIQLAIISTGDVHVPIHNRFVNDFSTACYIITRHHAKKLIDFHIRGDKYKLDCGVKPRPVADDLIYNSGLTFATPLLLYRIQLGSSIHPEHVDIFHKNSHDGILNFWQQHGSDITVDDITNFDPYFNKISNPSGNSGQGA